MVAMLLLLHDSDLVLAISSYVPSAQFSAVHDVGVVGLGYGLAYPAPGSCWCVLDCFAIAVEMETEPIDNIERCHDETESCHGGSKADEPVGDVGWTVDTTLLKISGGLARQDVCMESESVRSLKLMSTMPP